MFIGRCQLVEKGFYDQTFDVGPTHPVRFDRQREESLKLAYPSPFVHFWETFWSR